MIEENTAGRKSKTYLLRMSEYDKFKLDPENKPVLDLLISFQRGILEIAEKKYGETNEATGYYHHLLGRIVIILLEHCDELYNMVVYESKNRDGRS